MKSGRNGTLARALALAAIVAFAAALGCRQGGGESLVPPAATPTEPTNDPADWDAAIRRKPARNQGTGLSDTSREIERSLGY